MAPKVEGSSPFNHLNPEFDVERRFRVFLFLAPLFCWESSGEERVSAFAVLSCDLDSLRTPREVESDGAVKNEAGGPEKERPDEKQV